MAGTSPLSVWNDFFLSAGIPDTVANKYAVTFSQHRIRIDMLKEITKEILLDMGIKAMGDIIAILRHAKTLYTRDELQGDPKRPASTSISLPTNRIAVTNQSMQKTPTQVQTRPGLSISTSSVSKIHSRLGVSANGGLAASSQTAGQPQNLTSASSKRLASTTSSTLTKRLRVVGPQIKVELPEKTLTVHYPSGSAIARAQERLKAVPGSSKGSEFQAPVSVKARLGDTHKPEPVKNYSNGNNKPNKIYPNKNRFEHKVHEHADFTTNHNRYQHKPRESSSNERLRNQSGRLKSTVFNRLGDPAR